MKTTQKVYALLWVLAFLLGCNVWAAQSPQKVIEQTSQRMIDALGENEMAIKDVPTIVYDLIETIALPHFDVDYIVSLILGKHWRRATPDQRHRFKQAFQILVMNNFGRLERAFGSRKGYLVWSAVIAGGAEAWMVADALAEAGLAVDRDGRSVGEGR